MCRILLELKTAGHDARKWHVSYACLLWLARFKAIRHISGINHNGCKYIIALSLRVLDCSAFVLIFVLSLSSKMMRAYVSFKRNATDKIFSYQVFIIFIQWFWCNLLLFQSARLWGTSPVVKSRYTPNSGQLLKSPQKRRAHLASL